MKIIFPVLFIILILVVLIAFPRLFFGKGRQMQTEHSPTAKIGEHIINLEIADTAQKQMKGLGGRESLEENSGMLFVFKGSRTRNFWMRGMYFPIDIVWIRENGVVAGCAENVPPPADPKQLLGLERRSSPEPVKYVLELNAGKCEEWDIRPETVLSFEID